MDSDKDIQDVIVIGCGAAGLMAAASAGARGRSVLVLEKNTKPGVKILMSGGTRCNITHHCDFRGIADAFGQQGKFLLSALASLSPADVIQKIEAQGVKTKVEPTGKIFPVSDRAIDVRDALVRLAREAGAVIQTEQSIRKIVECTDGRAQFGVHTGDRCFLTHNVVVTTGGKSYPGCGTTGDGYDWAQHFGHSIVRTVPALTPLVCHQEWPHKLSGITIEDVGLSVRTAGPSSPQPRSKHKPLLSGRGPLLFTHFGFSGPVAMNLSRAVTQFQPATQIEGTKSEQLILRCDFLPDVTDEQFVNELRRQKQSDGAEPTVRLLAKDFPRRLSEALLDQAAVSPTQKNAELSNKQIHRLVDTVKRTDFPIHGTLGYKKAEVTAGGVNLKEVDSRNMQSKLKEGLYFAGEILDLDGPIGGFNFQAAFSTGWLAGQHA